MKHFFLSLLVSLSLSLFVSSRVFAHPIDIASVVVSLDGDKLENGEFILPLTWSITIPEVRAVLELAKIPNPNVGDTTAISSYTKPLASYIYGHFFISSETGPCTPTADGMKNKLSSFDLTLMTFQTEYHCPTIPQKLNIESKAFITEYPYQTTIVLIVQNDKTVVTKELTAIETKMTFPESSSPSSSVPGVTTQGGLTTLFQRQLKDLLLSSVPIAMLVAFIIGLLHSLEAGHSKAILASLLLSKQATIRNGLSYALVFTITHIADILLFGVVFWLLQSVVDMFKIITQLNRYALVILLFLSLYMLLKNILMLKKEKPHDHTHEMSHSLSFRKQLWIGFLTGLAPCVMGWSIFFLILSTKSVWAVFPVIVAFGGGIYLSLVIITLITFYGKQKVLNRAGFLSTYSPVISSGLLVVFSLLLLLKK